MVEDKIGIFLRAMFMENTLLQSYRALFLAVEATLIAAAFALIQLRRDEGILAIWIVMLGIVGLIIGIMWVIVCTAKGKDVDRWRDLLLQTTKAGNLKNCFSYMKSGFSLAGGRVARYWFNWIMPILIIILWIALLIWVVFYR
jgi:hypothetical protein